MQIIVVHDIFHAPNQLIQATSQYNMDKSKITSW